MPFLTVTQRTYGKQVGTAFVAGFFIWVGWVIDNTVTGHGLWIWVFPFLSSWGWRAWITGASVMTIAFILILIWILRPSDYRTEYIQQ